ncbi:Rrf2 family transcriptional regulator [Petrocella atlantisensis]|uniref:Rrf2 family transcriptional regulator n=1 Tax=Petrocella atlantisensis TaxID=2173034 RepID=A0A3P7S006_9FIRM|nr:Rrf2 family transcriptional regulator [Petrocella atlantisensis]VDN46269.1 Rrf2 family transcriptional regulator [Petrocella atlantisensis]
MIHISNKARCGIRIMIYIALDAGTKTTVQDIYTKEDMSKRYLEQIFADLKKNNLVSSIKGKHGGYNITRPYNEITAYDIIVALEGEELTGDIDSKNKDLNQLLDNKLWQPLQSQIQDLLSAITLEALVNDYVGSQTNMFYI